jgi:general secretion pathway protein E
MDIADLLAFGVKNNASDLHISSGLPPMIRVDGDIRRINLPAMEHKDVHGLIYDIMNDKQRRDYEEFLETDFSFEIKGLARFRVNVFNQNRGAGAVFRTIPSNVLSLEDLGAPDVFKTISDNPRGLVLVTGPTGSGKSTTLYAALTRLNDKSRNILTVEDPIEYYIDGIGQSQVNTKVDMTFARGLRAILRQDPDVVMVGEIRDLETAEIAVQASLTGHMVLSTLHTNTAIGAVTRLRDMGVEPFLLSSSVVGVLAQRLVRRLCDDCKEPYTASETDCDALGLPADNPPTLYTWRGCEQCNQIGYRGRSGLFELVVIDETMRSLIHDGSGEQAMEHHARKRTSSLREDGVRRVLDGPTTIEEVLRVSTDE